MLAADITDIHVLQILRVIFDIDHVLLRATTIRLTVFARTLHSLQVRESGILPGEFVQEDLVRLTRALLHERFRNESALLL